MADIQTDLNTIAKGKYGKDVRQAIHDAIETCYSDGRVGSVDLTARKQIAQLVTSGNKELTEQTLWSGSIYGTGASASLASAITNFDYLDLYVTKEGNVSIHTIPASRGTYIIRESNLPDDGAASFSISEAGVTFTDNSTISLYKEMYFSYENDTATGRIVNPTDTDSQSLLHLVKVVGRKSVTNTEVVDLRTPAEGMDVPEGGYSTAGDAVRGQISELKSQIESSTGMTDDFKIALENLVNHLLFDDNDPTGQTYITALHDAMYPPAQLVSISAVYGGGSVVQGATINDLKDDLTVTGLYDDESTETIASTDYTLSGDLNTVGTATITVAYEDQTTTFTVTVEEGEALLYELASTVSTKNYNTGVKLWSPEPISHTVLCETTFANSSWGGKQAVLSHGYQSNDRQYRVGHDSTLSYKTALLIGTQGVSLFASSASTKRRFAYSYNATTGEVKAYSKNSGGEISALKTFTAGTVNASEDTLTLNSGVTGTTNPVSVLRVYGKVLSEQDMYDFVNALE